MLTKILVTALVILACYAYLRHQHQKKAPLAVENNRADKGSKKTSFSSTIQWLAGSLVCLTLCGAIAFFIYDWLDDRQVLTVKVTSPHTGEMVTYQVYKGDMQERSFETVQGQKVRIANSERIEVAPTPD